MHHLTPTHTTASSLPAGKITRKQVAAHCGLCVRIIDNLTRSGVLGHYRIGKSIRYDLVEVEATLRARFHVGGAAQADAGQGSTPAAQDQMNPSDRTDRSDAATAAKNKQTAKP